MSLALLGRHFVTRSWCQKWRGLQHISRKFSSSGHQTCYSLLFTRDRCDMPCLSRYATCFVLKAQSFHCFSQKQKKRQPDEPPPRELDLLRYDLMDLKKAPKPALYLGFSGLIPFVTAPLFMAVTEAYLPELAFAQIVYGASIVSFLGGARWGFALPDSSPAKPDWINLANSVVPSLISWLALLCSHNILQSGMLVIVGLGISLHYDLSLLPTYPSWFKALRAILTVVAFLSLVGTLVIKGFYPEKRYLTD